jgi:thiamine pyrophosphokinase
MTWFRFNGFFSVPVARNTPARRGDTITTHPTAQEAQAAETVALSFDGPLLIVGGGAVDIALLREIAGKMTGLVGADSGADRILEAGLAPDAVIGDMDSIKNLSAMPEGTRIIEIAEQDTTDFEKALYSTRAPLTIALGMTGGRFDHTLAALHAVARAASNRRVILVDEHDLALGVAGSIRLRVGTGTRVSIYPLGRTVFASSRGLLYPLDGLDMEQGRLIGTSNSAVADEIEIELAGGVQSPWLLILDRTRLGIFL